MLGDHFQRLRVTGSSLVPQLRGHRKAKPKGAREQPLPAQPPPAALPARRALPKEAMAADCRRGGSQIPNSYALMRVGKGEGGRIGPNFLCRALCLMGFAEAP